MGILRVLSILALVLVSSACGSKTGFLSIDREMDSAVVDTAPPDVFETFPCRWSYGQPILLGRALGEDSWSNLDGAVHGRSDTVWVYAEDRVSTDTIISRRLSISDPPRILDPAPSAVRAPRLHGVTDGWVSLASDCSLGFFDDEARARRLVIPARAEPPCLLSRLDPGFIDVTHDSGGTVVFRHDAGGDPVFSVGAELFGFVAPSVVSPDGRWVAAFASTPDSAQLRSVLIDARTGARVSDEISLGTALSQVSTSVDRLRPAALVLLAEGGGATLLRLPLDPDAFTPGVFASISSPPIAPGASMVTNETEALVVLERGTIAIQPLSGSVLRFLEPPEPDGVLDMRILLAPGESRGGVLYSHIGPEGNTHLSFRMLVCNR